MTKIHVASVSLIHAEKVGEAAVRPYLSLYRLTARSTYTDGTASAPYPYDAVLRKWLDAVAIILIAQIDSEPAILLRAAVRPPMLIRHLAYTPIPAETAPVCVWELPAGLIEPGDEGESGIVRRAVYETLEETGFRIDAGQVRLLPGAPYVTPGVLPERIWFALVHVEDAEVREHPVGDGSPLEDHAECRWVALGRAIEMCDAGEIDDMKTELGIRRAVALL